jgi:hypothetical protein
MNNKKGDNQNVDTESVPAISGERPDISNACCKVQRVTEAYRLIGIDNELQRRYESENATLHELADYLNNRITAVALAALDNPTNTEPATVRAALDGEDSIPATRRDDLRAILAGQLNIDLLTDAYVSHETIRRHLNDHLDISTSKGGFDTFEEFQETLRSYQYQYENGVHSALKRACKKGLINGGNYNIFNTRVECQHCSETYRLHELLKNRGCSCQLQD